MAEAGDTVKGMASLLDRMIGDHTPLAMDDPFVPADPFDVEFDDRGIDLGDDPETHAKVGLLGPMVPTPMLPDEAIIPHYDEGVPAGRVIQFGRVLSYHRYRQMHGRDVLAVQRALAFAHLRFHEPTMSYGWLVRDEVKLLQARHGLPRTGVYGPTEHRLLLPWFDGYSRWLYTHADEAAPPIGRTAAERRVRALWYLYAHRPMAYHAVRPFLLYGYGDRLGYTFDCSWLYTEASYLAKTPDPNGEGYNGYGNTTTLREHGVVVGVAQPGDAIHYGVYGSTDNPAHVAGEVGKGCCIGHGGPGGPRYLPSNYRPIVEMRRYP